MASLNAIVDVVEPQRDLADSIARTILGLSKLLGA